MNLTLIRIISYQQIRYFENSPDQTTEPSHTQVVERVSKELVDGDKGMALHLDSEAGWAYWKEKMTSMKEVGNYEFALFMYCKLNQ